MPRIYRKMEYTPEQRAEIARVRNAPQTGEASGEKVGSAGFNAILKLIAALKARREELGIGQAELADKMGIDRSALCRLEAFKGANPTTWTLCNWAAALDYNIEFILHEVKAPALAK